MRIKETLRILGGSILVYVAVATCAGGGTFTTGREGGTANVDGLTNPVPAAVADPNKSGSGYRE
jgi:hypothetical protein